MLLTNVLKSVGETIRGGKEKKLRPITFDFYTPVILLEY